MKRVSEALGGFLLQPFMSKDEYREEDRAWRRLQRPFFIALASALCLSVLSAAFVSLSIVFPRGGDRPFCSVPDTGDPRYPLILTDADAAQYFWSVLFIPTALVFGVSVTYLLAGMAVAYSAPERHGCIKVVENNCCASKRGGVRCLVVLNLSFAVVFGILALFLGSTILTLETHCSTTLFWCYEVICWGLVLLFGGTCFFLRLKAAVIMDEGEFYGSRTIGMELLEASAELPSPDMEKRMNAGFRSWMGSSILSSDEDEGPATGGLDNDWEEDELYDNPHNARRPRDR